VNTRIPFTLIAALLIDLPLAAQTPPDPLVKENVTQKVGDHTYVIPDGNVGLVPNVGIIVGSQATLVIDPGLGRVNGQTVLREVEKVSRNQTLYIATTHFHAEHTTGYLAFPTSAKYVNSTIQEQEFAEGGMAQVRTFSGRSPKTAELLRDAARRVADITFDREFRLDLGGVHVRLTVVGPTHTRGDTVMFVEEDRVLFAGDVVMNNSFVAANAASSVKSWLAAFDLFEPWGARVVVPSHGSIGDGTLVATNRTFMLEIQTRTRALKAQGRSADDTATAVQAEMQAKHPQWARVGGVAAASRAAYSEAP
jgi:glyoxylase-like metal-dependent hydrolase (beta-lactamase superfamily II)